MEIGDDVLVVVTYDVDTKDPAGARRLRRVAKCCTDYGQRVQSSVFECSVDATTLVKLKSRLKGIIDEEKDSLRFYNLGNNYSRKVDHVGVKTGYDPEGFLFL